jgi:hypothetical protein
MYEVHGSGALMLAEQGAAKDEATMNTTDTLSKDRTPAYDEIQVLLRRAHEERSKYFASELQLAARAFSRWGTRTVVAAYTALIKGLDPRMKHQPPEDRRPAHTADR